MTKQSRQKKIRGKMDCEILIRRHLFTFSNITFLFDSAELRRDLYKDQGESPQPLQMSRKHIKLLFRLNFDSSRSEMYIFANIWFSLYNFTSTFQNSCPMYDLGVVGLVSTKIGKQSGGR